MHLSAERPRIGNATCGYFKVCLFIIGCGFLDYDDYVQKCVSFWYDASFLLFNIGNIVYQFCIERKIKPLD